MNPKERPARSLMLATALFAILAVAAVPIEATADHGGPHGMQCKVRVGYSWVALIPIPHFPVECQNHPPYQTE